VRLQLEPFAAAEAAAKINETELEELSRLDAAMRDAPTGGVYAEYGAFAAMNSKFHELIAAVNAQPVSFGVDSKRQLLAIRATIALTPRKLDCCLNPRGRRGVNLNRPQGSSAASRHECIGVRSYVVRLTDD
jgi:FCD domain